MDPTILSGRTLYEMRDSPIRPLLSPKKVALIWLASLVLLWQVMAASCHASGYWRGVIPAAFALGHVCLVYFLAHGRLLDSAPISRRWTDVATVLGAQWVGPICWYCEWRRGQTARPTLPLVRSGTSQTAWIYFVVWFGLMSALLIAWRLYVSSLP